MKFPNINKIRYNHSFSYYKTALWSYKKLKRNIQRGIKSTTNIYTCMCNMDTHICTHTHTIWKLLLEKKSEMYFIHFY